MAAGTDICITGMGAVTSVGASAEQTAASVRAGVSRFEEHPLYYMTIDPPYLDEPQQLRCAPVAMFDLMLTAPDRLLGLAVHPLQEVFLQAGVTREDLATCGVFLAAPPAVDGVPEWGMDDAMIPEFLRRAALPPMHPALLDRRGSTAFFHLLAKAAAALQEGTCRMALVGGVDSYLYEGAVEHYDQTRRFLSSRNKDGFIPGEAGGFVLLETRNAAERRKAPILACLSPPALAREEQPFTGDANSTGTGLTQVVRSVVNGQKPDWILCDLNGERYRGQEWGTAYVRLAKELDQVSVVQHPADSFGDIRAAAPVLQVILAAASLHGEYAPGTSCLVFAGSDDGDRGALQVFADQGRG